jgi:hypothetical protein
MGRATIKRSTARPRKTAPARAKKTVPSVVPAQKMSPKLAAFVRKHWPEKGREERIRRAEEAWQKAMKIAATFKKMDREELIRIAEDPDLEDM